MRILILSNYPIDKDLDLNSYKTLADPRDIDIRDTTESAKDFIRNALIQENFHLDFILITRRDNSKREARERYPKWKDELGIIENDEFAAWIRGLKETYSQDNFQLNSIPIILDDQTSFFRSTALIESQKKIYDLFLPWGGVREDRKMQIIGIAINRWLDQLANELDRLNLDTEFDFKRSLIPYKDSFDLKILSQGFIQRQQGLNYIWVGNNLKKLDIRLDIYEGMLKNSYRNERLRNEKEYHSFFLQNLPLIQGEYYEKTFYEKHLYYSQSMRYMESDFINYQYAHSFRPPQVLEIKLPNQRLAQASKNDISRYLKKSLYQVGSKYQNYLSNAVHFDEIKAKLPYLPKAFDYTLLIGKEADKEENWHLINQHLQAKNYAVNIIAFDELLKKYNLIYNRVKKFGLF